MPPGPYPAAYDTVLEDDSDVEPVKEPSVPNDFGESASFNFRSSPSFAPSFGGVGGFGAQPVEPDQQQGGFSFGGGGGFGGQPVEPDQQQGFSFGGS